MITKTKKIVFLLLVNLLVYSGVFLLAEYSMRKYQIPFQANWTPSENAIARFDETLGWDYIPNLSKTITWGSHIREVYFNENGIRVSDPEYRFSGSTPTVLFVGGSYTMGQGLSYDETFVGQFGAKDEMQYQAVNLGVQGYGTDQAFLRLKKHVDDFNTKIVVYTFMDFHVLRNGNYDRRMIYPNAQFIGTKPKFSLDKNNEIYLDKRPQSYQEYSHSYVWDFLRMKYYQFFDSRKQKEDIELTHSIIRAMNEYCDARGVHFVVINWRYRDQPVNQLSDLGIPVIDTLETAPYNWGTMIIPQDGHPNKEANEYVAGLLYAYFEQNDLL